MPFAALTQSFPGESFKGNEQQLADEMVDMIIKVSQKRHPKGDVKRFNQAKSLGCFNATFSVYEGIPEALRVGMFANHADYSAQVRFASASTTDDRDKDLRGMSIRVSGVSGTQIWGQSGLQDFVLNSHPVLFADTPETFLKFIHAQHDDSLLSFFLNPFDSHIGALMIILKARDHHTSPFDIRYWSTTPYRLGDSTAVKYSVKPCHTYRSEHPDELTANYLRASMHSHLQQGQGCFDFMIQRQTDNDTMPIEDTSVEWSEDESPFVPVAQITLNQQEFMTQDALDSCEQVSFNPWQSLEAHAPLGRMNYVRRDVYKKLAEYREQSRLTSAGKE